MYRKIEHFINEYLKTNDNKILCIYGARQVGKTYIIRLLSSKIYKNYIEINFDEDNKNNQYFKNIKSINDFYLQLSAIYGNIIDKKENTIIFLDEIQVYPQYFSLLKQLSIDNKYKYICSGSKLGISLKNNEGLSPMGSIIEKKMYPMDFEEFLLANGCGKDVISYLNKCFLNKETVNDTIHKYMLNMFYTYLYVGGLPECVKTYVENKDISKIKEIQNLTYKYYSDDASKYDLNNKLKIKKIYDMILSNMENKVKRIRYSSINNNIKDTYSKYYEEFEYLINSGIALENKAISNPKFPLVQSSIKNLIKLYYNDVGILSEKLYKNNINAIIKENTKVNLGSIYETFVAQELIAHNHNLFYYDRKKMGEVDFLIDDYNELSVLPIEIKSSKKYLTYRAIPKLVNNNEYNIKNGYILSNKRETIIDNKLIHLPIYNTMFI